MVNEITKILVIPKASAMVAEISGATAPIMLPGRKKRAYPKPLRRLGESCAMIAEFAVIRARYGGGDGDS
jgi:hypothetical protein